MVVFVHGPPTLHVAGPVEVEHKLKPGHVNVLHHQIWGQIAMVLIRNGGIATNRHVLRVSSFFGKLQFKVLSSTKDLGRFPCKSAHIKAISCIGCFICL